MLTQLEVFKSFRSCRAKRASPYLFVFSLYRVGKEDPSNVFKLLKDVMRVMSAVTSQAGDVLGSGGGGGRGCQS